MKAKKKVGKLVEQASFVMRDDVLKLIKKAHTQETKSGAKKALERILDNAKIAKKENLAICQDTGLPIVFIEAGKDVKIQASLIEEIKKGVEYGYRKNYLRPSMVDPHLRDKSSYEGAIVHIEFSLKAKGLKIIVFPKGFGSENKSQLKMFNPTAGIERIEEFILDCVKDAGPESCPPFIVGVGVGGASDTALLLAKKSFLSRIDKANPDKKLDKLEKSLLKKINALGIGPMGLGGKSTCLAVKIKKAPTHIAGLPVGVNISCWALRSATIKL